MSWPSSTYRLQIRSSFDLRAAAAVTDYLVALGVGAVYCSPVLQAGGESDHGYDVVDPVRIDEARGGREGWRILVDTARTRDLRLVVDIVPNHLGVAEARENPAWWDVLRLGPRSAYAAWFDIEQGPRRLLLPVLGDSPDLDRDLTVHDGELRYYEHAFPIAPGTRDGTPSEVHDRQHYELVSYRRADAEQNYRRFFAITTLAGVRVEDPAVFAATHEEILRWIADGEVDGLRVDHPDGLADPAGYLARLRAHTPLTWLTVEKILQPGELLPPWPVDGTTGYDALAEVTAVLVDPSAEPRLDSLYRELTGDRWSFRQHMEAGKRLVATTILQAEVNRLSRLAPQVESAAEALTELVVAFPVYRSYLPEGAHHLAEAIETARARRPDLAEAIGRLAPRLSDPADELCIRFQQTSAAVMAKGVEDTAYYRYNRFVALNEVGGDPARIGGDLAAFHAAQQRRMACAPHGMTTLSTHDTKRGEDVRARLFALAEVPDEWATVVERLMELAPMPNRALGYLVWQTFVGTGFIERGRMHAYVQKAMREAHDGTGWTDPDESFESTVHGAVDAAYGSPDIRQLLTGLITLIEPYGWANSLSQKVIQLTMPGVPDVYQGTERWEDALVDPDNRRPVDFSTNRALLVSLDAAGGPPIDGTGAAKLWVVSRTLRVRRDRPELFTAYRPVYASGPAAEHVVAFDRGGALDGGGAGKGGGAITVATRLPARLAQAGGWRDTTIALDGGHYTDVLTGRVFDGPLLIADVLATYPVALLIG
jgi:(1->4)-alpha-D-glucan 1-alpha-D-glucosylmutase